MSLVNIWIGDTQALVAVDTAGYGRHGAMECSKFLPLPHANMLFAGRGNLDFMRTLHTLAHTNGDDLDSAEAAMADRLVSVLKEFQRLIKADRMEHLADPDGQEVHLVGWSAKRARMVALAYAIKYYGTVNQVEVSSIICCPWDAAAMGEKPVGRADVDPVQQLLETARAQVAHYKPALPRPTIGGRLLVADIRAASGSRPASMAFFEAGTL